MNENSIYGRAGKVAAMITRTAISTAFCVAMITLPTLSQDKDGAIFRVPGEAPKSQANQAPRESANRSGTLQTQEGLTLRLKADLGTIRIGLLSPKDPPSVQYVVHMETDAPHAVARRLFEHYLFTAKTTAAGVELEGKFPTPPATTPEGGAKFWVQFEVMIPPSFSVEASTGNGNILTKDIGGVARLYTQAGNIATGHLEAVSQRSNLGRSGAKLRTDGGHIQVMGASGNLSAFTAGGHIVAGKIDGAALLRSGGGHIRVARIGGRAELIADGGNISVGETGDTVTVRSGGGQIDFGEAHGPIHAQTEGGGIRVINVSGPLDLESTAGAICLTRVASVVHAATVGGNITAWITPDEGAAGEPVRLSGPSQLTSGDGNIIVYLPRNLAISLYAMVENGGRQRIEADAALPVSIKAAENSSGPAQGTMTLNGGGAPLVLRSTSGKIQLKYMDTDLVLRKYLVREEKERLYKRGIEVIPTNLEYLPAPQPQPASVSDKSPWIGNLREHFEVAFMGGVREEPGEFKKRLVTSPPPGYPDIARTAGVEGIVRLQVHATADGRVEVGKILEGAPSLVDAAIGAVKQWRVHPLVMNGKPVDVVSVVTFNFQLHQQN